MSPLNGIPKEWAVRTLGDTAVAHVTSGGTPSRANPSNFDGMIPWIKSGELKDCDIYDSEEHISYEAIKSSSAKLFQPNTVLIAMYGATVGKTALLKVSSTTNQAVCAIRPIDDSFFPKYLQFHLMTIRPFLLRERYGGAQPNISQTIIKNLQVSLPPLPEQKKIATVLSKIWMAVEAQGAILENLKELKKSMMNRLFTQGLRGEPLKKTEIGMMPKSWEVRKLSEECMVKSSAMPLSELQTYTTDEASNLVLVHGIKVSDMNLEGNETHINTANTEASIPIVEAKKRTIPKGAVIFPKRGAAIATNKKRMATTWTVLDPNLISVIPGDRVASDFLFQWFLTFDLLTLQDPGPTPQLNKKDLDPVLFPLPSKEEQIAMAGILGAIETKRRNHKNKQSALQDLFKTTLNQLMTGQLRVKDLDIDTSDVEIAL